MSGVNVIKTDKGNEMSTKVQIVETKEPLASIEWNRERIDLMKRTFAKGTTDDEFQLFIATCKRTGLSPEARQVFAVKRYDSRDKKEVMSIQVSIDGFRLIAQRSGHYAGQLGPYWCGADGKWEDVWLDEGEPPVAAKVAVLRNDFQEPLWAVARWTSYCQRTKDDTPTAMWRKMPDLMLAKCAEALLLRRAAPAKLAGVYSSDEMAQAGNIVDVQVSAPRPEPARVIEAPRAVAPADAPKADPAPVPPAAEEQTRPEFVKKMESDHVKTASGVVEVFRIICESGAVYQTTSTGLAAMARTMMVKAERAAVTFIETPRGLGLKGIAAAPVAAGSMAAAESALLARAKAVMVQGEFDSWSEILQTPAAGDWEKFEAEIIKAEESAAKLEA